MTERHRHADTPAPELDAQSPYNGLTALHDAVCHGHLEAARALVDAGAPLDLRTDTGLTPRELARFSGYDDLARYLAEAERASSDPWLSCNDRASETERAWPMRLAPRWKEAVRD